MIMFLTIIHGGNYSSEETIQRRKLFKGGNYSLLGGFDCGNYSKEETIQGRKLYEEIRYMHFKLSPLHPYIS
jgi:hypothetical protein